MIYYYEMSCFSETKSINSKEMIVNKVGKNFNNWTITIEKSMFDDSYAILLNGINTSKLI